MGLFNVMASIVHHRQHEKQSNDQLCFYFFSSIKSRHEFVMGSLYQSHAGHAVTYSRDIKLVSVCGPHWKNLTKITLKPQSIENQLKTQVMPASYT